MNWATLLLSRQREAGKRVAESHAISAGEAESYSYGGHK